MSREEYMQLYLMSTVDVEKTEQFLKSDIETEGFTDVFRQFLVPKNQEVPSISYNY